jgi:hypothetical protein
MKNHTEKENVLTDEEIELEMRRISNETGCSIAEARRFFYMFKGDSDRLIKWVLKVKEKEIKENEKVQKQINNGI